MNLAIASGLDHLLGAAKWAFTTRRVIRSDALRLERQVEHAQSGDLVLGRVTSIGSHQKVQLAEGRPSALNEGDLVVAACGARYASDQFEGIAQIDGHAADLLAGGGCVGRMRLRNARMKQPTRLAPLGLLADRDDRILNLARYGLVPALRPRRPATIGVLGASMNAGKTTAAAALVHGLRRAGHAVAAIKATGTGAFGDYHAYADAGASFVADFTDAGMASTYCQPLARLEQALDTLLDAACEAGCEVAVVEFADGVLQQETAALLGQPGIAQGFDGFVLAVPDALAALGGCTALRGLGIEPRALTGLISQSPLSVAEAEAVTGLRVLSRELLSDPAQATALFVSMTASRTSRHAGALGIAA